MTPTEKKALQVKINKALDDEKTALNEYRTAKRKYDQLIQNRKVLEKQLAESNVNPSVSEHALLRYLQRVHGIDIDEISKQILTEPNKKAISVMKSGKLPLGNGVRAVIKDQTVVSILTDD